MKVRQDELVATFHEEGFVPLKEDYYSLSSKEVNVLHRLAVERYKAFQRKAMRDGIDLDVSKNSEVIEGFYVRKGGRIDMQLTAIQCMDNLPDFIKAHHFKKDPEVPELLSTHFFDELVSRWTKLVHHIFLTEDKENTKGSEVNFCVHLEYVGCVVSRPGDLDQNWHIDGIHKNREVHETADRVIIFVPLVDLDSKNGPTEMKKASHFTDNGKRGTCFDDYKHLESITHHVGAGTPIIMDYRIWHRGGANTSEKLRPLLYFKFIRKTADPTIQPPSNKKRKRITPIQLA